MQCFVMLGLLATLQHPAELNNRDPLASAIGGCQVWQSGKSELIGQVEHRSAIRDGWPIDNKRRDWRWQDTAGIYWRYNF